MTITLRTSPSPIGSTHQRDLLILLSLLAAAARFTRLYIESIHAFSQDLLLLLLVQKIPLPVLQPTIVFSMAEGRVAGESGVHVRTAGSNSAGAPDCSWHAWTRRR